MNQLRRLTLIIAMAMIFLPAATHAIAPADNQSITDDTPYYDPLDQCASGTGTSTLTGKDNIMKTFNYLIPKGLTAPQVAGIIGNLMAESTLDPNNSGDGQKDPTPRNGVGFGIAQWTFTVRQQPLVELAKSEGVAPNTLGVQLDYIWEELTGKAPAQDESKALADLKKQTTPNAAAIVFMIDYEGPLVPNGGARAQFATDALKEYSQTNGGSNPGVAAAPAGTCTGGVIDCTTTPTPSGKSTPPPLTTTGTATTSLTVVRQNIVCITKAELDLWTSKKLVPANGYLKYTQNRVEEWCADFASWVYNQAKDPLASPDWNIPGVVSIQAAGQNNPKFAWHPVGSYTPVPGDLAIHGGDHVNIIVAVSGNNMTLIGGDQGPGPYPGGSYVSQYSEPIASAASGDGITGFVSPK